jgi:hypothetical protein
MQLDISLMLKSAIKSLEDCVVPAIEKNNKMAQEQVQLSIKILKLVLARVPIERSFQLARLERSLDLAGDLLLIEFPGSDNQAMKASLRRAMDSGGERRSSIRASSADLSDAENQLLSTIGHIVQEVYKSGNRDSRDHIKEIVLEYSRNQLVMDRLLLAEQGWEDSLEELGSLQSLLSSKDWPGSAS